MLLPSGTSDCSDGLGSTAEKKKIFFHIFCITQLLKKVCLLTLLPYLLWKMKTSPISPFSSSQYYHMSKQDSLFKA